MALKKLLSILLVLAMLFSMAACTADDAAEIIDILLEDTEPSVTESWTEPEVSQPDETEEVLAEVTETTEAPLDTEVTETGENVPYTEVELLDERGTYTSKDEVALYIFQYGHLPDNFITKKQAEKLGWPGGSLEPYAPGKCIGGSRFGNYEGKLPTAEGRVYTECDIDTLGAKSRGAKRIVFSNDGLIYYTGDHYETFELLYGEVE